MHRNGDFDLDGALPWNAQALAQDLELDTLFDAMALKDAFLRKVALQAVFAPLTDPGAIVYRQAILGDCLTNPAIVRAIYALAVETIEAEKKQFWRFLSESPDMILRRSVEVLTMLVVSLKRLRHAADEHAHRFHSEGFTTLFTMLQRELSDDYFGEMQEHLKELRFRDGVLVSAELGAGNKGANYVLRKPRETDRSWWKRIFAARVPSYTYQLHPRDESGARYLSELRSRGLNLAANALAQSNDHILSFFIQLRTELAFYVGCLNLHERLAGLEEPACLPIAVAPNERQHSFVGLYDVCLALTMGRQVVGNDVEADDRNLVVITGANQGGKSTFLRSVGLAQLMMQCGMFVPAEQFRANICSAVFTHYKREEDVTMKSGKLDEELGRMSDIVDHLTPDAMVLFNESFAATNEREGSEIARQIVDALAERGIKMLFVTHLHEFARRLHDRGLPGVLFLRADRKDDGTRTFKVREGKPLQTSYGEDLYRRIFEAASAA
jgi:DNA mismatch repair ATPase MutS